MIFLQISKRISFYLLWLFLIIFFVDSEPCRPGVDEERLFFERFQNVWGKWLIARKFSDYLEKLRYCLTDIGYLTRANVVKILLFDWLVGRLCVFRVLSQGCVFPLCFFTVFTTVAKGGEATRSATSVSHFDIASLISFIPDITAERVINSDPK